MRILSPRLLLALLALWVLIAVAWLQSFAHSSAADAAAARRASLWPATALLPARGAVADADADALAAALGSVWFRQEVPATVRDRDPLLVLDRAAASALAQSPADLSELRSALERVEPLVHADPSLWCVHLPLDAGPLVRFARSARTDLAGPHARVAVRPLPGFAWASLPEDSAAWAGALDAAAEEQGLECLVGVPLDQRDQPAAFASFGEVERLQKERYAMWVRRMARLAIWSSSVETLLEDLANDHSNIFAAAYRTSAEFATAAAGVGLPDSAPLLQHEHVAMLRVGEAQVVLLADARRAHDLIPEKYRVHRRDGLIPTVASQGYDCDLACAEERMHCAGDQFAFASTCTELEALLPCERGCLFGRPDWPHGPSYVAAVGRPLAGYCVAPAQLGDAECAGGDPGVERLCPCVVG